MRTSNRATCSLRVDCCGEGGERGGEGGIFVVAAGVADRKAEEAEKLLMRAAEAIEAAEDAEADAVYDIRVAIPSSLNYVSVTTELLTTGLVGPLRSLSANSREQEYEQAATSCSHCNSLIQHAPLRYR